MMQQPALKPAERVFETREDCRLCGSLSLQPIWSFGETPLANNYLLPKQVGEFEPKAPLDIYFCEECSLVQMRDVVQPELLFDHYLYVSSTSKSFVKHFEEYADYLVKRFDLDENDLVVDIGSNDGVLLKPLQARGVRVLGVDPAENVAREANAAGIPTVNEYFTVEVAKKLKAQHGPARVISANNVFAHTDGIIEFTQAVKDWLAVDGVFVFEVQYLGDLVEKNLFDVVYHEHVNYYHLTPLVSFFKNYGLEVFDVLRPEVHGGSLRVLVGREEAYGRSARVESLLNEEEAAGLNRRDIYREFADKVEKNKQNLRALISQIKQDGGRIVGYGAPAKATTLMHAFDLTGEDFDFIVDDAEMKQGRVMPGTHVPIVSSEELLAENPDYCVILAWNFEKVIRENNQEFVGKWIVPVPKPRIV